MTKEAFLLSIATSLIAMVLGTLGSKSAAYLRSKRFRKTRRRFIRSATAWGQKAITEHPVLRPALTITFYLLIFISGLIPVQYNNHVPHRDRMTAETAHTGPIAYPISCIQPPGKGIAKTTPCLLNNSVEKS